MSASPGLAMAQAARARGSVVGRHPSGIRHRADRGISENDYAVGAQTRAGGKPAARRAAIETAGTPSLRHSLRLTAAATRPRSCPTWVGCPLGTIAAGSWRIAACSARTAKTGIAARACYSRRGITRALGPAAPAAAMPYAACTACKDRRADAIRRDAGDASRDDRGGICAPRIGRRARTSANRAAMKANLIGECRRQDVIDDLGVTACGCPGSARAISAGAYCLDRVVRIVPIARTVK